MAMAQLGYTNRMLLSLVFLQIYTAGITFAVYAQIVKNLTVRDGYIDTTVRTSCCINGECDILCCIRRGNCFYANKKQLPNVFNDLQANSRYQKRMIDSFASETTLCYDVNNKHHLPLWDTLPPDAISDDPCRDIPFLKVFLPHERAPRTDVAIIIFPGGGYDRLANTREQAPVARYFAHKLGITSFVLYYRLVQKNGIYRYPVPMWDGQRAVRYVRYNAARFNINPNRVGLFGFSAGGHLASTIALHPDYNFGLLNQDKLDTTNARPNFLGLGYPVISMDPQEYASHASWKHLLYGYTGNELISLENFLSGQKQVNSNTPPTFLFESVDDQQICSQNSLLFVKALQDAGVPHKALLFDYGKHGAGLAKHEPAEHVWPELFYNWLIEEKIISAD